MKYLLFLLLPIWPGIDWNAIYQALRHDTTMTGEGSDASPLKVDTTLISTRAYANNIDAVKMFANTSDATSHTVTMDGYSFKLIEGTNISLATLGTSDNGTCTISATGASLSDGDKGDVTVASGVIDIDAGVVGDNELGTGIDVTQLADGTVTSAELQYINSLTSNAQTQLTARAVLAGSSGGQTLIGGTGTTDDLILQSTSGVGATGALIQMKVGNNGGTIAQTILNNGLIGIGTTSPTNLSGAFFGGSQVNPLWVSGTGAITALVVQGQAAQGAAIQFVNESSVATGDFGIYSTDLYFVNRANSGDIIYNYYNSGGSQKTGLKIGGGGTLGVQTSSEDAACEINLGTAQKLRLSYNDENGSAANYMDATISSTGSPTFNATGTSPTFTFSDPVLFDGYARLKAYTVGTLPTGVTGAMAYVTDATAPTYLGALTGGGAVVCPVFYNGTAWVSH